MLETENSGTRSSPVAHPEMMYCSDPNCPYCKELREAEERLKRANTANQKATS